MLEFGGLRHCVDTDRVDEDGFPRPVGPHDPARDVCRDHLQPDRDGHGGYATRYLRQPAGSEERKAEYDALRKGEAPAFDRQFAGYRVDKADSPAVDIQQAGGAFQRLTFAVVVFLGALGAVALLGFLSLAVILAQVVALVLLGFAPVALVIGIFPGAGHAFFRSWLTKLATAVFIKALYSLVIAIVVAVSAALAALDRLARVPVRVRAADAVLLGDLPVPQADHRAAGGGHHRRRRGAADAAHDGRATRRAHRRAAVQRARRGQPLARRRTRGRRARSPAARTRTDPARRRCRTGFWRRGRGSRGHRQRPSPAAPGWVERQRPCATRPRCGRTATAARCSRRAAIRCPRTASPAQPAGSAAVAVAPARAPSAAPAAARARAARLARARAEPAGVTRGCDAPRPRAARASARRRAGGARWLTRLRAFLNRPLRDSDRPRLFALAVALVLAAAALLAHARRSAVRRGPMPSRPSRHRCRRPRVRRQRALSRWRRSEAPSEEANPPAALEASRAHVTRGQAGGTWLPGRLPAVRLRPARRPADRAREPAAAAPAGERAAARPGRASADGDRGLCCCRPTRSAGRVRGCARRSLTARAATRCRSSSSARAAGWVVTELGTLTGWRLRWSWLPRRSRPAASPPGWCRRPWRCSALLLVLVMGVFGAIVRAAAAAGRLRAVGDRARRDPARVPAALRGGGPSLRHRPVGAGRDRLGRDPARPLDARPACARA